MGGRRCSIETGSQSAERLIINEIRSTLQDLPPPLLRTSSPKARYDTITSRLALQPLPPHATECASFIELGVRVDHGLFTIARLLLLSFLLRSS